MQTRPLAPARRARLVLLASLLLVTLAAGTAARFGRPGGPGAAATGASGPVSGTAGALSVRAALDRSSVLRGGDGLVRVELVLEGRGPIGGLDATTLPTDFVVVLDRSGSMQGEPLLFAKAAVRELYTGLRPQDRFALVGYASDAALEIPLAHAGPDARPQVERVLGDLVASGGTHMSAGLDLAHEVVASARAAGRVQRVLLLSDGHANQGDFSTEGLRARAARAVPSEYVLSAVGVGVAFDETLMSAVADAGTGNFYYLPDARELAGIFAGEFAAARETVARGLQVSLAPGDGIELVDAAGYPLERDGARVSFRPGDLHAGQERRIWLTLRAPTERERALDLGDLALRWQEPDGVRGELPALALPALACVAGEDAYYASFDASTYERSSTEALGHLKEKVAASLREGNVEEALIRVDGYEREMRREQSRALGHVVEQDASALQALRSEASSPAASTPEMQKQLGKKLLEEGRDARRAGAKY
ncbi:MAG TPA: VWA domain-containing protein [Myxococcota bacterium]|nr:VWA domain-containing protein [Myxococcota bacterium]